MTTVAKNDMTQVILENRLEEGHSHQSKYKIIKIYTVTERFCYCLFGYNSYPRHILGHGNKLFISGYR